MNIPKITPRMSYPHPTELADTFFVVTMPQSPHAELGDICAEVNVQGLVDVMMGAAQTGGDRILGLFSDREEATFFAKETLKEFRD